MTPPQPPKPPDNPTAATSVTPAMRSELAAARRRNRKIRRAVSIARFDGWTTLLLGALTVPTGVFHIAGYIIGAALVLLGLNAIKGADELRRFKTRGATRLGLHQIALCLLIVAYCLWRIVYLGFHVDHFNQLLNAPELTGQLGQLGEMLPQLLMLVYVVVIFAALLLQGAWAFYYFTRAAHVRRFLRETPDGAVDLLRD